MSFSLYIYSLRSTHPEYAELISALAEKLSKGFEASSGPPHLDLGPQEYSKLAVEYEERLAEIRELDGYERFLLPKRFSELREAASRGPVIMLNASTFGCDGLILASPSSSLHRIRFLDISHERVLELQKIVKDSISKAEPAASTDDSREDVPVHDLSPAPDVDTSFRLVLRELWSMVVKPCIEYLQSLDVSTIFS